MLSSQHFCVVHLARSAWSWTGHWAGHYWLSVFWFIFQIYTVDLDNHADYGDKFRSNRDLGIVFWASLIAANLLKEPSLWDTNKLRHKQTETDTSLHWDKQWDINRDTNKLRHKHWETKQWDTNKMNTNKQTNKQTETQTLRSKTLRHKQIETRIEQCSSLNTNLKFTCNNTSVSTKWTVQNTVVGSVVLVWFNHMVHHTVFLSVVWSSCTQYSGIGCGVVHNSGCDHVHNTVTVVVDVVWSCTSYCCCRCSLVMSCKNSSYGCSWSCTNYRSWRTYVTKTCVQRNHHSLLLPPPCVLFKRPVPPEDPLPSPHVLFKRPVPPEDPVPPPRVLSKRPVPYVIIIADLRYNEPHHKWPCLLLSSRW